MTPTHAVAGIIMPQRLPINSLATLLLYTTTITIITQQLFMLHVARQDLTMQEAQVAQVAQVEPAPLLLLVEQEKEEVLAEGE
jgi:hypothetical protein